MSIKLFGLEIGKVEKEKPIIVQQASDDGATEIVDYGGVFFDGYDDILKSIKTEEQLIKTYRSLVYIPEVDQAVIEIVSDAVVYPKTEPFPVKMNLDSIDLTESIKNKINKAFEKILRKMDFESKADDLFRKWYIDGRLPAYIHVDGSKTTNGISKIIFLDALQITKVREIKKQKDKSGIEKIITVNEYYIYDPDKNTPREFADMSYGSYSYEGVAIKGLKLSSDAIVYATSGLMDEKRKFIISHLHKAIKPANQLAQIEDAMVIYRLSRAPERRVFYVDVGNLPKQKAEQYLSSLMAKFRNKLSYDSTTGQVANASHQKSILEDFWLPRREGGKGTEINTLGGGDGFAGITDETKYFKDKLYKALNVPIGRLDSESVFVFGNSGEISRDEVKFSKFINGLRNQFSKTMFDQLLKTELVLTKVMTIQEWDNIHEEIMYMWEEDSHFAEIKSLDVTSKRIEVLEQLTEYVTPYFSKNWVRKNILFQTEEEIEELRKEREEEEKDEPDVDEFGDPIPSRGVDASPEPEKKAGPDPKPEPSPEEEEEKKAEDKGEKV